MRVKVTKRGTGGAGSRNEYELRTDHAPTGVEVETAQAEAGFAPAGYGSPMKVKTVESDGEFVTTWQSFATCD